jgi:hypothetical protein
LLVAPVKVILKQKIEAVEVLAGLAGQNFETANAYQLRDMQNNQLYSIVEEQSDCQFCCRQCFRHCMPLHLAVINNVTNTKVMDLDSPCAGTQLMMCCLIPVRELKSRNMSCGTYCALPSLMQTCCCLRKMYVHATLTSSEQEPKGTLLGSFHEKCTLDTCCCCASLFHVLDSEGGTLYRLTRQGLGAACYYCWSCQWNKCEEPVAFFIRRPDDEAPIAAVMDSCNRNSPTTPRFVDPPEPIKSPGAWVGGLLRGVASDLARVVFTDADNYLLELPDDDVTSKALLIASTVTHDFINGEDQGSGGMGAADWWSIM